MSIKDLHPNVKIRIVVNFLTGVAAMLIMPYIAIYFSERVGATITGFLFVCVILCGIAGGIIGGFYGDRVGRRKMMLLGEGVIVISFLLIALFNSPWFDMPYVTFVIFLFDLFFEGMLGPASQALLIDSSTSENRRLIYQIQYWVGNLSVAIGSMVGGFLFQSYHFYLFLLIACMMFISFLTTLFFIKDTYNPKKSTASTENDLPTQTSPTQKGSFLKNYAFIFKDRIFLFFILATLFTLTIENQLTNYISVRLANGIPRQPLFGGVFGIHVNGVGLLGILRSENTLLVVFGSFLIAWIVKKINDQAAIIAGTIIFTAGYVYLTFGTVPSLLVLAMLVTTIGELTYMPVKQAYLADIAPEDSRSSYMAINGMVGFISMIIAGFMISIGSFVTPGVMAGVIAVFGLIAAVFFYQSGQSLVKQTQVDSNNQQTSVQK